MEELIIQDLLGQLIPKMQESGIKKVYLCTRYTESGSSTTEGNYLDEVGNIHVGLIASSKKLLREYQNQTKTDPVHRFNKVEFEVFKDGTYNENYYWDEELLNESKLTNAKNMAGWLSQRIPTMVSNQGYALYDEFHYGGDILHNEAESNAYGLKRGWLNGIFTFDFQNNDLKITIEVEKANGRVILPIEFPDWLINDLWEHYQITNNGLLAKEWKPWNVLEIKLEKDIGHQGGKTIEPEIKYLLL